METSKEYVSRPTTLFSYYDTLLIGMESVFASWDAEEYGIVGSTEWVEEYAPWLSETAITYLNVDIAVNGACKICPNKYPFNNLTDYSTRRVCDS